MIADYHMHTRLCKHAQGEPEDYLQQARQRKITEICFTDHVPAPDGYDPVNRMNLEQFDTYREMVRSVQLNDSPTVLFGIEADYYQGCESFLADWLRAQKFDLVIGSIHYIRSWGFDNPETRDSWDSVDIIAAWREYFSLLGELVQTGLFDVVGHLDLPKKFGHRPDPAVIEDIAAPVLDLIASADMGIEINTSGLRRPVGEIYPSEQLLRLAAERSIPICLGSDAHCPEQVGYGFDEALALARRAGCRQTLRMRGRQKELIPLPA